MKDAGHYHASSEQCQNRSLKLTLQYLITVSPVFGRVFLLLKTSGKHLAELISFLPSFEPAAENGPTQRLFPTMSFLSAMLEPRKRRNCYLRILVLHVIFPIFFPRTNGLHHMKRAPLQYVSQRDESRPLSIVNRCAETIYPGIATQAGTSPLRSGFELLPGGEVNISVSADWQGRVWGRTNCSFNFDGSGPSTFGGVNGYGRSCSTGDCNGILSCQGASVSSPSKICIVLRFSADSLGNDSCHAG